MMFPKCTGKLVLSLLYLTMVVSLAGVLFYRFQSFDGVLVIAPERTERWVVRPGGTGNIFSTTHRNMPLDVIGFDHPQAPLRVLNAREVYDAAKLPFHVRLAKIDLLEQPPDVFELVAAIEGNTLVYPATPGLRIQIPEGALELNKLEPWAGLLRDQRGHPMINAVIASNCLDTPRRLILDASNPVHPCPEIAVRFRWHPSESDARQACTQEPDLKNARWGIRENGRIHWFDAFVPGTGITLSASEEYTLLDVKNQVHGDHSFIKAITVEHKSSSDKTNITVEANHPRDDVPVVLESNTAQTMLILHAWRDGAALVQLWSPAFFQSAPSEEALPILEENGEITLQPHIGAVTLRLDQLYAASLPVPNTDNKVMSIELAAPGETIRLREGEMRQLAETRLSFRRSMPPPVVSYTLTTTGAAAPRSEPFTLRPGQSRRLGSWTLRHDQQDPHMARYAILRAQRIAFTPSHIVGGLLFIMGIIGISILRFANWSFFDKRSEEETLDDKEWSIVEEASSDAKHSHTED